MSLPCLLRVVAGSCVCQKISGDDIIDIWGAIKSIRIWFPQRVVGELKLLQTFDNDKKEKDKEIIIKVKEGIQFILILLK